LCLEDVPMQARPGPHIAPSSTPRVDWADNEGSTHCPAVVRGCWG
jgi:hypothetical protein